MLATMVETWLDNHLEHTQYKIMAIIAGQINPANYPQPDYSGVVSSAQMQAQGLADIGKSISGVIDNFGEAKKEQKKVDAYNKASAKSIEAAITLGNSYEIAGAEETLRPFLDAYNDPNLSPIEKAALLDEGKAMIPNVFGRFDQSQANAIQQAQVNARGSSTGRSVNLQQGEITETIGGKQYKIPVIFDPSTGETRRLDGTTVGAAAQTTSGIDASQTTSGINAALNLPIPALTGNSNRDATAINNAQQLPSVNELDNTPAIMLTGGMPDGQGNLTNVAPMPPGSPTTMEVPPALPPGAVPLDVKEEKALSEADRIKIGLPPGNYIATFTGDKPSNIRQIESPPDSLEKLKENRMLKADERITNVIASTDQGSERLVGMNEALALLNSGEVKSGAFKDYKVKAARIFGMDVASEEQFNSLVGNLAMEAIDLTKGAISDREMTFFREELAPGLNKSVEGNKRILEFKIKAAKRGLRINQVAREMLSRNELPDKIEAEIKKIQDEASLVSKDMSTSSKPNGVIGLDEKTKNALKILGIDE